eukprot:3931-Heterococcus_DN1.PRE.3
MSTVELTLDKTAVKYYDWLSMTTARSCAIELTLDNDQSTRPSNVRCTKHTTRPAPLSICLHSGAVIDSSNMFLRTRKSA